MAKDFAARAITAQLKPLLIQHGFYRRNPKTFVRIRGDLVDVISFQMSQYGSKLFYLHYYCNLIPMPDSDFLISSYNVGFRVQQDPEGAKWQADTAASAFDAMNSVVNVCENKVLPWFQQMPNVQTWLIEYLASSRSSLQTYEVVIGLLLSGHTNRPWWLLTEISEQPLDPELDIARQKKYRSEARKFADKVHNNSYQALLNHWKATAISKHGLEKAVQK